jgi:septal ring factor EnvC (AmiA/AmiB activator)
MLRLLFLALLAAALAGGSAAAGLRRAKPAPPPAADAAQLDRDLAKLRAELVALGRAQAEGESEAAVRRARLRLLDARESELRAEMGGNRVRLARLLGALQLYQRDPPPPLFVHAGRARDAARAAVLMKTVAPELRVRGAALGRHAEALRRLRRDLTLADESLMLAESDLAERRGEIDQLQLEQAALEGRSPAVVAAEARARALAVRSTSLGELVGGLQGTNRTPPLPGGLLLRPPVQGALVRRFGQGPIPGSGPASGRASGLTWRTAGAAEVLAPVGARVDYVGPLKGYGLVVILTPSERFHLVLAGLDRAAAGAGRTVLAGEPIGRMAEGGSTDLYLEVREGGEPVDPARWLAAGPRRGAGG